MMHTDILDALLSLEKELRALSLWGGEEGIPDSSAFMSTAPFCVDTMEFHQWLEYVLIPKLGAIAKEGGKIPKMALLPAGEVYYRGSVRKHRLLLKALSDLDRICAVHTSAQELKKDNGA